MLDSGRFRKYIRDAVLQFAGKYIICICDWLKSYAMQPYITLDTKRPYILTVAQKQDHYRSIQLTTSSGHRLIWWGCDIDLQ